MLPNNKTLEEFLFEMGYSRNSITGPIDGYPLEEKRLLNMLGDLPDLLKKSRAILAGGAITSLMTNKEINDFDIYFRDKEGFSVFMAGVLSHEWGYHTFVHHTDRSVLMTNHGEAKIQAIVYKFFPSVQDVFNDFDFTVNMGAYDFAEDRFVFDPQFFKHNAQRYLEINTNTAYPMTSVLRVDKYREKGYKVSKAQMMKLLFRVSGLQLNSWEEAIDHLGGMYGIDPKKIFDQEKEFSVEEAISQLSSVEVVDNNWTSSHPTEKELGEHLKNKLTEKVYEAIVGTKYYYAGDWLEFIDDVDPSPCYLPVAVNLFA